MLSNGWFYGEAGNYCMATRVLTPGGAQLWMRLAKWNDLSDSIILWTPDLAPFDEDSEAEAERNHGIDIRIDGRSVRLLPNVRMLQDFDNKPGPSYRIGIDQQRFIAALRRGRSLAIRRNGRTVATFPVAGSANMAVQMAECVERPVRM